MGNVQCVAMCILCVALHLFLSLQVLIMGYSNCGMCLFLLVCIHAWREWKKERKDIKRGQNGKSCKSERQSMSKRKGMRVREDVHEEERVHGSGGKHAWE